MKDIVKISAADNVAVALRDLKKGEFASLPDGETLLLVSDIPFGHKAALRDVPAGDYVIKYGFRIGRAKSDILRGGLADERNIKSALENFGEYVYVPREIPPPAVPRPCRETFEGYLRASGEAGVRNEIWIVPLVSCVNKVAEEIARRFSVRESAKAAGAVLALTHAYGCSQLGCDHENTKKILADLCLHPNAGGVLVLGLGCENNRMSEFKKLFDGRDTSRIRFMQAQSSGDEIADALDILEELAGLMRKDFRTKLPISKLRIGLKCGGSDAFSGISANALIGRFADAACSAEASCVLCEVPEMFGAEAILMNRAESKEVFLEIVGMINSFKEYFLSNDMPIYENPSPGNKAGGISTLEEKSLGCVQKGGGAAVRDVLRYGGRVRKSGLTLLESPGNDPVAATALAAAGCQMILFSTGRGTPFASVVPTIKISSNTPLFEKKPNWIDFDAGPIVEGADICALSEKFFDFALDVAEGKKTLGELNGYGEISIFKTGVTL